MEKLKYGYTNEQYKKFNSHAWRYLLLFSFLYCAHYCTRLNLGNAQVAMTEFTSGEIGIITSALFWSYGIGHLINGRLGEIVGIRKFIILSVILSVVTNFIMGFQSTVWIMAIVWGLNGFFQSMAWSPGVSSLNTWWPSDKRGFSIGFADAFSGFGLTLNFFGYVEANESCKTNMNGVFVAGDCRSKEIRQITTATADGATAALAAIKYIG